MIQVPSRLDKNGTVWRTGNNASNPFGGAKLTDVTAISSGDSHILALKGDGTVWTWGSNTYGQLGNNKQSFVMDADARPVKVAGLSGVMAISAGGYHNVVLKGDGTVWTWGRNEECQLGIGKSGNMVATTPGVVYTGSPYIGEYMTAPVQVPGLTNISAVSAGELDTYAIADNGTIWAWGDNEYGQLGDMPENGTGSGKPSLKDYPVTVTLNSSGDINGTGPSQDKPVNNTSNNNMTAPAPGSITSPGLTRLLAFIILLVILGSAVYYVIFKKK